MKYTNIQLQQYFNALNIIASKVTGKLAYLVTRNARKISDELKEYNSIRDQKINEYGELTEDGIMGISPGTEGFTKFISEMKEYDEIEQDISFLKVKPEDLYSSDLNAVEMDQLLFMIDDEEDS